MGIRTLAADARHQVWQKANSACGSTQASARLRARAHIFARHSGAPAIHRGTRMCGRF